MNLSLAARSWVLKSCAFDELKENLDVKISGNNICWMINGVRSIEVCYYSSCSSIGKEEIFLG